jgi:Flp pilus assembly protein TadD
LRSGLILAAFVAAACASTPTQDRQQWLAEQLRARDLDPQEVIFPFEATPEMEVWVGENIVGSGAVEARLKRILDALLSEDRINFGYEVGRTVTASEVFSEPTGNCLSFANLFVALARAAEIPVYFMDVDDIRRFEKDGDLVIVSGHVTAGYGPPQQRLVLEFNIGPQVDYRLAQPIADLTAVALYYSNRGAEELRAGDNAEALEWLETAALLDPQLAGSWVNLGVARRRNGDLAGAEQAYRRALEVDPRTASAYQNLAAMLRHRGQEEEALELLALVERIGSRNPYNYLSLGDLSLRQGRVDEAGRFYRKAVNLAPGEAEPAAAMGYWALAGGDLKMARRWLKKARKADPDNGRVRRLEQRLLKETG